MEKSISAEGISRLFDLTGGDLRTYSPLTLAYIGDAVYELVIRTMIVEEGNAPVNKLHKRSSALVKAAAQAQLIHAIEPFLNEEELGIYKRGRNAKSYTTAKNASVIDYRTATGFEALMGWLYLKGDHERMLELIHSGLEQMQD